MDLLQIIVLGFVQAATEWLPLSSKTMDALAYTQLFGGDPLGLVPVLLFLHLGTLFAAAIYFRKEILALAKKFLSAPLDIRAHKEGEIGFIITALLFTGVVGVPILLVERFLLPTLELGAVLCLMGAGLIVTGFLLSTSHKEKSRLADTATWRDGVLTGALQGLSAIPGVSRAGASTTALIWRDFNAESAFHLSFVLSVPTVLVAEIILWAYQGGISAIPLSDGLALVLSSFFFGYLMIDVLLKIARRINLASLAFIFGIMMLLFGLFGVG